MLGSERRETEGGTEGPEDNMYRKETDGMGLERKGNKAWITGKVMCTLGLEAGRVVCWNKIGSEGGVFSVR